MSAGAGKVAVVTGGSSGIGLAVARRLAQDGYRTIVAGRDQARLKDACAKIGLGVSYLKVDVSRRSDVAAFADKIRRMHPAVDVLVNNAGVMKTTSLRTEAEELERIWDETLSINLKGVLIVSHALADLFPSPGGRIINMSSIASQTGGAVPGMLAYSASKAGVNGLTMALAREFAPRGVTVNAVAPGMIEDTGLTGTFDDERKARARAMIPIGRAGLPHEVAAAVAWLASEDAGYVTGSIVSVNGGWRFG
jgi:3-oxoacyl-[acyl-carrier protein] reductase